MESTSTFQQLYQRIVESILKGKGASSETDRKAAFDRSGLQEPLRTLIDKVANQAYRITDADVDAAKKVGKSEDEIFELVICGAVGQASRQYMGALSALQQVEEAQKGGSNAS